MKQIIYTRADGGLFICYPTISSGDFVAIPNENPKLQPTVRLITEEEALQRAIVKDIPADAINVCICEASDVPNDRTFRNAWKLPVGALKIDVDMPKARNIWRDKMREKREPELKALDLEYLRADERGDLLAKTNIKNKKQKLRDIPADPRIEAAQTPEELKAVTFEVLSTT